MSFHLRIRYAYTYNICRPPSQETPGGRQLTTTWAPLNDRAPEDRIRAQATGGTTSKVAVDHRTLMGVRTFMAERMTAGDQDQDTRVEGAGTGGEGTGGEATEETGALRTGSVEESLEGGERTGKRLPSV